MCSCFADDENKGKMEKWKKKKKKDDVKLLHLSSYILDYTAKYVLLVLLTPKTKTELDFAIHPGQKGRCFITTDLVTATEC